MLCHVGGDVMMDRIMKAFAGILIGLYSTFGIIKEEPAGEPEETLNVTENVEEVPGETPGPEANPESAETEAEQPDPAEMPEAETAPETEAEEPFPVQEEPVSDPEETEQAETPAPVHGSYEPLMLSGRQTVRRAEKIMMKAAGMPEHTCFYWLPDIGKYIGLINNTAVCLKHNSPGGANVSAMGDLESLLYEQGYREFGYLMKGGDQNRFIGMLYRPIPHDAEGFAPLQVTMWGDPAVTGYPCDVFGQNIDYSSPVQIAPDSVPVMDHSSIFFPMYYPGISSAAAPGVSGWINGSVTVSAENVNDVNDGHPDHDDEHTHSSGLTMYVDWDLDEKYGQFQVELPAGKTFEEGGYEIIADPGLSCDWMSGRNASSASIGCTVTSIWNPDKTVTLRASTNVKYVNDTRVRTPDITADDIYRMMAASIPVYRAGSQPVSEGGSGSLKNEPYAYGSISLNVHLYTSDLDVRKYSEYGENVPEGQEFVIHLDHQPYAKDNRDNSIGEEDILIQDVKEKNGYSAGTNGSVPFAVGWAPDGSSRLLSAGTGDAYTVHDLLPRTLQSDTTVIFSRFTPEAPDTQFTIVDPAGRDIEYEYAADPELLGTEAAEKITLEGGRAVVHTSDTEPATYYYRASSPLGTDASGNLMIGSVMVYAPDPGMPVQRTDKGLALYEGDTITGCTSAPVLFSRDRTFTEQVIEGYAEPVYGPEQNIIACAVTVAVPDNGVYYSAVAEDGIDPDSFSAVNVRNVGQLQLYGTIGSAFAVSQNQDHLRDAVLNGTEYDDVYRIVLNEENSRHLYTVDPKSGEITEENTDGRVYEAGIPGVSLDQEGCWYYAGVDAETGQLKVNTGSVQVIPSHDPARIILKGTPDDSILLSSEDDPDWQEEHKLVYDAQGEIILDGLKAGAEYVYHRSTPEQKRFYYVIEETGTGDAYETNRKKETVDLTYWNVPDPATGAVCYAAGGEDGSPGTRIKEALCTVKVHQVINHELRTAIELTKYDVDSSPDGERFTSRLNQAFFTVKDVTFTVPGNGKLSPADPDQGAARPDDTVAYAVPVFTGYTGARWLQVVDPDHHEKLLPLQKIILVKQEDLTDGRIDTAKPYEVLYADANGMVCLDCIEHYRTLIGAYQATLASTPDAGVLPEGERLPAGTYIGVRADHLADANAYAADTHMVMYQVPGESEGRVFIDFLKYGHTYEITEYRLPEHTRFLNETEVQRRRAQDGEYLYYDTSAVQKHYVTISSEQDISAYSDTIPQNSGHTFRTGNLPVYVYQSVKGIASNGNYVSLEDPTHEYYAHRDLIPASEAEALVKKQRVKDGWTLAGDWSADGTVQPNDGSFYTELSTKGKPAVFQRIDSNGDPITVQKAYIDDTVLLLDEKEISAAKASHSGQAGFPDPAVYHLGWADKRLVHVFIRKRANEYYWDETVDGTVLEITNISDPERIEIRHEVIRGRTGYLNINGTPGAVCEYTSVYHFKDPQDIHQITLDDSGFAAVEVPEGIYWYRDKEDIFNERTEMYEVRRGCVDLGEMDYGSVLRVHEISVPEGSSYLLQEDRTFTVLAEPDVHEVTENYVNRSRVSVRFMKYENNDRLKERTERTPVSGARFDVYVFSHDDGNEISSCIVRERMKDAGQGDLRDGSDAGTAYSRCTAPYDGLRGDGAEYAEHAASDPHLIGSVITGAVYLGMPGETYDVSEDGNSWQTVQINAEGIAETAGGLYFPYGECDLQYRRSGTDEVLMMHYVPGSADLSERYGDVLGLGETVVLCETEAPAGYETGGCAVYRILHDGPFDTQTGTDGKDTVLLDYFEAGSLRTSAVDARDGDRIIDGAEETIRIKDTVTYTGLDPAKKYQVCGTLHVRKNGEDAGTLKNGDGSDVTACSVEFSPEEDGSGSTEVLFTFPSSLLGAADVRTVVFEDLLEDGIRIMVHADINDREQTVQISRFRTTATDASDGDHVLNRAEDAVLTDRVSWSGLTPGETYTIRGTVHRKENGEDAGILKINDQEIRSEQTFTPQAETGTTDVIFRFDSSLLEEGTELVVFEDLRKGEETLIEHHDISDEDQTVVTRTELPALKTYACTADGKKNVVKGQTAKLQDRVYYEHIPTGVPCTLKGEVHRIRSDGTDAGIAAKAEYSFTPEKSRGIEILTFEVDTEGLEDTRLVVFETLTDEKGSIIAEHRDPGDIGQTLYIGKESETADGNPSVSTTAYCTENGHDTVPVMSAVSITDRVDYRNLVPGETYELKAEAHIRDESGRDLGKTAETVHRFVPGRKDGTVYIDLIIDTSALEGRDLVMFEYLYKDHVLQASHAEILDQGQTVSVSPVPGTRRDIPWIRTGSGKRRSLYLGTAICGIAGILLLLKKRKE